MTEPVLELRARPEGVPDLVTARARGSWLYTAALGATGLLALAWNLYEEHPNLLPTYAGTGTARQLRRSLNTKFAAKSPETERAPVGRWTVADATSSGSALRRNARAYHEGIHIRGTA